MKKYLVECPRDLWERSLEIAIEQIGTTELTGHNDGTKIDDYLDSIGLKGTRNPYCAAGLYYCFLKACLELGYNTDKIPMAKSGLALANYKKAKKSGNEVYPKPEIGDLIVWEKPNHINGHIGRITKVNVNSLKVETIEFNTMNTKKGNQRDGDGVWERKRDLSKTLGSLTPLCLIGQYNGD